MKPKYLEFCGINSFSEPAKIDFEKLLSGGIFGIFGDTGSGKTTILDSIVFALYGKIERARGGVGADIINYNCDKAYVNFDFESVNDSGRTHYRIEREIRRKNSLQKAELFKIKDGVLTPLADGKVSAVNTLVQEIIGLSFEDFKKCIALPQGEFSQFVKAEKSDRLKLISRLFDLEEYGEKLNGRVRDRYTSCTNKINYFEGQLAGYEGVSREVLKGIDENLKKLEQEKIKLDKTFLFVEEKYNAAKKAYDKKVRIEQAKKDLEDLNKRENEIAEKNIAVSRHGGATLAKNTFEEITVLNGKIFSEKEKIAAENVKIQTLIKNLAEAEDFALTEKFDDKLTELRAQHAKIEYLRQDIENFNKKSEEISELKTEYVKNEKIIQNAENELERLNKTKQFLEGERAELNELGEPETLLKQNFGSSLLKEEYNQALEYFNEKLETLRTDYTAGTPLYTAVEKAVLERIDYYAELLSGIKTAFSPDEIFAQFKKLRDSRDKITKEEHGLEVKLIEQKQIKSLAEEKISSTYEKCKKLQEELSAIKEKLSKVLGGCEYSKYIQSLNDKIDRTVAEKKEISERIEKLKQEKTEKEISIKGSEASLVVLNQNLDSLNKTLRETLDKNGFSDMDEVYNLLSKYPAIEPLQKEIEKYNQDKLSLNATINALSDGYIPVTEEELASSKAEYDSLVERRQNVYSDINLNKTQYKEISDKLTDKIIIEKQLEYFKNKLELLEKLRALIKGNQFMEFIASEYLSDISTAASETLLKLTSGRYFIRYKQGFFVGDNFNGGELRTVSTLSGGETFLVSLSLALSLSSAIYAKSLKPIEFFFLDEGFGTLDEKLIDTVMDSLEKLKNTHFSIGLISHVEELKHRIDNKITVIGATEGGSSKIQINY